MPTKTTSLHPNSTTIASSHLVEVLGAVAKVYYFARMVDQSGSGWATFTLKDAAEWLGCKSGTVRKNLSLAKKRGCFYNVNISNGVVVVRYASDKNVCNIYGLKLGATFRVSLKELDALKGHATFAHVDMLQTVSMQKRKQELKKSGQKHLKVYGVDDLFNLALKLPRKYEDSLVNNSVNNLQSVGAPIGKSYCAEQVYFKSLRYLFVKSSFQVYGVSQARVGSSMCRHERTIRRRLANVSKVQIAQNTGEGNVDWRTREQFAISEWDTDSAEYCRKRFNVSNKTFEPKCNIYSLSVELVRQSWKRKKLSQMQES